MPAERVPALDGLRGVAIVAVVATHAGVLPGGFHGVTVFFVLSGFLITGLLLREHDGTGRVDLKQFWLRRSARIAPALLVTITLLTAMVGGAYFRWGATMGQVGNLVVTFFGGHPMAGFSWTWSLATEEQFYLLWPAFLVFALARGRRRAALRVAIAVWVLSSAGGLAAGLAGHETAAYYAPWFRVDALAAGCTLALLPGRRSMAPSRAAAIASAACLVLIFSSSQFVTSEPIAVLASAGLVVHGRALPGLSSLPLRHLGQISYGLYLWHATLLCGGRWDLLFPNVACWLAASLVAAEASWWGMERPIMRRVGRRGSTQSKPPQAVAESLGEAKGSPSARPLAAQH
jgi:peptidoglycan/LPS O-acetylase OafA/YrhL